MVQEIQFFLNKKEEKIKEKAEIEGFLYEAENENDALTIDELRTKLTAIDWNIKFFDNKISVAWYELKYRNDKQPIMLRLFYPIQLDKETWELFLATENLLHYNSQNKKAMLDEERGYKRQRDYSDLLKDN